MGRHYRVHLEGYDFVPYFKGETKESPRESVFCFTDDGDLAALCYEDWKIVFLEQRAQGTLRTRAEPFTKLRL